MRTWSVSGLSFEKLRDHLFFERIEGFLVPEKIGNVDQQVFDQRLHFLRFFAKQVEISRKVLELVDLQVARDAAKQRRVLVIRKIVAGADPYQRQYFVQIVDTRYLDRGFFVPGWSGLAARSCREN